MQGKCSAQVGELNTKLLEFLTGARPRPLAVLVLAGCLVLLGTERISAWAGSIGAPILAVMPLAFILSCAVAALVVGMVWGTVRKIKALCRSSRIATAKASTLENKERLRRAPYVALSRSEIEVLATFVSAGVQTMMLRHLYDRVAELDPAADVFHILEAMEAQGWITMGHHHNILERNVSLARPRFRELIQDPSLIGSDIPPKHVFV